MRAGGAGCIAPRAARRRHRLEQGRRRGSRRRDARSRCRSGPRWISRFPVSGRSAMSRSGQTYVAVEDQGVWVLQGDGKTHREGERARGVAGGRGHRWRAVLHRHRPRPVCRPRRGVALAADRHDLRLVYPTRSAALHRRRAPRAVPQRGRRALGRGGDAGRADPRLRDCGHDGVCGDLRWRLPVDGQWAARGARRIRGSRRGMWREWQWPAMRSTPPPAARGCMCRPIRRATWTRIEGPPLGLDDVKVSGGVISVLGNGTLVRSSDGGASWTTTAVSGAGNLNAVQFLTSVAAAQ